MREKLNPKQISDFLNIPKKHALRHYLKKVCELYGKTPKNTQDYIEEQILANEGQLDQAIDCFKGLLSDGKKI